MENKRDIRFDWMRGIGILLMIVGHTILVDGFGYRFIYSFHMPLFFLISGYFANGVTISRGGGFVAF